MANLTDPATELASIAQRLAEPSDSKGAKFLADKFGVQAWTTEFMKILTCILERADLVADTMKRSGMDEDTVTSALDDLGRFKSAFTAGALYSAWNSSGGGLAMVKTHGHPLRYMSSSVRPQVSYPKLDEVEIRELITLIDAYLENLPDDGDEPAFVRQAIRDGLGSFRFQLVHFRWMGAGYTLSAFRDVVLIYDALQRQFPATSDLDPLAALKGLGHILRTYREYADTAKGWADSVSLAWSGYKLASAAATTLFIADKMKG